jgi:hypothetical protein
MAASSPLGDSLVWKTTPKEPLPTILHWVYCISFVSPVKPSWTFSRITSVRRQHVQSEEMNQWMEGGSMASCMADARMAQGEEMNRAGEGMVSLPPMRKLENAEGLFCDMIAND